MSERIHSEKVRRNRPSLSRPLFIVAGTAMVVLVAAILLQLLQPDGQSAVRNLKAGVNSEQTGKAHVGQDASQKRPVARIASGAASTMIYEDELARECIQRVGRDVLENIINRTVIQLACEESGIVVTQEEVNEEVNRIAKEFNLDTQGWLEFLQAEREITPAQYQRDIIWPMLALKKLAGEQVTITEADMQQAFQRHYGPRVKARMIMCDNLRRAQDVWQKAMKNPDDFERLAREHSVEPNSRALDGKIPPIPRYSGNDELEKAAFKLRENEISGIIHIGLNRYVILKCEGHTEQLINDIEEVRAVLYQELEKQKVQEMIARYFESLKEKTRVDNYLANTSTGGPRAVGATGTAGPVRQAAESRVAAPRK